MPRYTLASSGGTPLPVLKPLSGSLSRSIRIDRQICIVGSHSRVHLPLHSTMVSRTHALIVVDGHDTFIRDLASRNGVYVNGIVTREGRLRHGDLLCIGPFAFCGGLGHPTSPRPRHLLASGDHAANLFIGTDTVPRRMDGYSLVIGRRTDCDIVLEGKLVEAVHAVLYRHNGKFHIRDLNTKTGMAVNGRRVRKAELRKGDEIRIGLSRMRFEPPEPTEFGDAKMPTGVSEQISGLMNVMHADHPISGQDILAKSCPTIEQLLGAAPGVVTQWRRASW